MDVLDVVDVNGALLLERISDIGGDIAGGKKPHDIMGSILGLFGEAVD